MMGKSQRRKGVVGEQDVAKLFRAAGFLDAKRTGVAGQDYGDLADTGPYMVEVKRSERLDIPGWWAKLTGQAKEKKMVPLLVFRRSNEDWKVCVDLEYFLELTGGEMFSPGRDWRNSAPLEEVKIDWTPEHWLEEPTGPAPEND